MLMFVIALENCPLSELIVIDDTYKERLELRRSILDNHPDDTYLCNPVCEPAVMELYEWVFGTYLPRRFPTMYKLVTYTQAPSELKAAVDYLYNITTGEYIPLKAPSAKEALYTLGVNVDDEFLLLLPSSTAADGSPIYHLQAFVTCFPSGFSTPDKLGLPLAGIHKPVPGYKAKLEKSMDRFFAKMETGKAVRRVNWSLTTNTKLFSLGGNHLYSGGVTHSGADTEAIDSKTSNPTQGENAKTLDVSASDLVNAIEEQKKDVNLDDCRLRCERQTLHRLPKTKALVFGFKTYQYTLDEVKAAGDGPALAAAAEGLSQGSVPDMAFYKRAVVWGDKVTEYLRS